MISKLQLYKCKEHHTVWVLLNDKADLFGVEMSPIILHQSSDKGEIVPHLLRNGYSLTSEYDINYTGNMEEDIKNQLPELLI